MNKDTVTISSEEYTELKQAQAILEALYAGGVDNWEWYEDAIASVED